MLPFVVGFEETNCVSIRDKAVRTFRQASVLLLCMLCSCYSNSDTVVSLLASHLNRTTSRHDCTYKATAVLRFPSAQNRSWVEKHRQHLFHFFSSTSVFSCISAIPVTLVSNMKSQKGWTALFMKWYLSRVFHSLHMNTILKD
jgi:hypothetical protein